MNRVLVRLFILTTGVLVVSLASIFLPGRKADLYLGLTVEDLVDIVIQGPFLALALWGVFRALPVAPEKRPLALDLLLVVGLFLFFTGFGIHWAGNSAHNAMERWGERPRVFDLVYFYDEILGHKVTYLGFFALLVSAAWLQVLSDTGALPRGEMRFLALLTLGSGAGGAFSALEGQTPVEGLVLSAALALGLFFHMRRRGHRWGEKPVVYYAVVSSILVVLFEIGWFLRWGGFPQPSDLWGI